MRENRFGHSQTEGNRENVTDQSIATLDTRILRSRPIEKGHSE